MLHLEMADPTAFIAFTEKPRPREAIAAILDAVSRNAVEVVFPPFAGRVQRIAGVFPRLMRRVIPLALAIGRPNQAKLSRGA
jgi:hypothetical protein